MNATWSYVWRMSTWFCLSLLLARSGIGQNRRPALESTAPVAAPGLQIQQGTLLQVDLARRTDWKHLARNSVVEGNLMLPVFVGNQIAIPEGTKVSLMIESVRKVGEESGAWKKAGHALVRAFNPIEKGRPVEYAIRVSRTEIETLQASLMVAATALRAGYAVMIEPKVGKAGAVHSVQAPSGSNKRRQTVILQLEADVLVPTSTVPKIDAASEFRVRNVHAFLLTQLSASHSRKDDAFQARLAEPVRLGEKFFEEGSLVEGTVSQSARPRMLSRAGSLHLRIDRITSPRGESIAATGALGGVEAEPGAKYELDEEGGLRGLKPGVTNAVVDLSIAYTVGKVTDDLAETPIRALGAAMSDAAIANAARYFGLGGSAVFLITRRGRDVYLPRYSEIEIDFGRLSEDANTSTKLHP